MRLRTALSGVLLVCSTGSTLAAATITVVNQSDFGIHHLFLSSSEQNEWGPDQLGESILEPGRQFLLNGVPPGLYDTLLVDEDGDECIVEAIEIAKSQSWIISNSDLLECQAFGR